MKYLEIFLLCALSSLAGYTICVWQPKPHIVKVMDQGKPGKAARKPLDLSKWSTCEAADKEDWNGYACVDGKPVRVEGVSGMDTPLQIIDARDPLIVALGQAIAVEEGWNVPDSLARRLHNPGMLVFAGQLGSGRHMGWVTLFTNPVSMAFRPLDDYAAFLEDDDGWAAEFGDLRAKWWLFYGPDGTDLERVRGIAYNWSTGDRKKYARDVVANLRGRGLLK